jgi:nucleoside 2-deoxyribosyltransferase
MFRLTVYLASPLGFSPELFPYREKVRARLTGLGCSLFDPWEPDQYAADLERAHRLPDYGERVAALARVAAAIGRLNEEGIRRSDAVLGVLDGTEVDSGTASEIGFAAGLGKRCYGLRTDLRDSGDFTGLPVNLQLLHFIERSGGKIFRSIGEIEL